MALHFERIGFAPELVNYRECLDLQREVHREVVAGTRGNTVLMVEHNLKVVADISDRITVLRRGEKIAEGNYDEVAANREVRAAYMGGAHA